jgi:hypothetical protein
VLSGSATALAVAGTLAVLDRPVSLDECLAIEAPHQSSREVIAALEELVRAELETALGHASGAARAGSTDSVGAAGTCRRKHHGTSYVSC